MPARDPPAPPRAAGERAAAEGGPAQVFPPAARVVLTEAQGEARLVDAFALYAPDTDTDTDERTVLFDGPRRGDDPLADVAGPPSAHAARGA
jgi:hypothetical protein